MYLILLRFVGFATVYMKINVMRASIKKQKHDHMIRKRIRGDMNMIRQTRIRRDNDGISGEWNKIRKNIQDHTDRNWIRQTGTELNKMDMIRGYRDMVRRDRGSISGDRNMIR